MSAKSNKIGTQWGVYGYVERKTVTGGVLWKRYS